jgi:hypothetical protein
MNEHAIARVDDEVHDVDRWQIAAEHVLDGACEVEFSDDDGKTCAELHCRPTSS